MDYANDTLFSFVKRLEFVLKHTLTPEILTMNGLYLIKLVYESLNTEKVYTNFFQIFVRTQLNHGLFKIPSNISHGLTVACEAKILHAN